MVLRVRRAGTLAVLALVLSAPLVVAAQSRSERGKPERSRTAQRRVRSKAPPGRAEAAAPGDENSGGAVAPRDARAVVRWVDENGTIHYTPGYEVPERYRSEARRVRATVGTVPVDHAEESKAASPAPATPEPATETLPPGPDVSSRKSQGSAAPQEKTPQGQSSGAEPKR